MNQPLHLDPEMIKEVLDVMVNLSKRGYDNDCCYS